MISKADALQLATLMAPKLQSLIALELSIPAARIQVLADASPAESSGNVPEYQPSLGVLIDGGQPSMAQAEKLVALILRLWAEESNPLLPAGGFEGKAS